MMHSSHRHPKLAGKEMEVHLKAPPPLARASGCPWVPEKIPPLHALFSRKQPQVASYLADQLQRVPGGVSRPDDRQGWLIIWQTEPGWSEILVDPNVTVGIVLVYVR